MNGGAGLVVVGARAIGERNQNSLNGRGLFRVGYLILCREFPAYITVDKCLSAHSASV